MVKHSLATMTSLLLLSVATNAADFNSGDTSLPIEQHYNWSGAYVGGHGGYSWFKSRYDHIETAGVGGAAVNSEHFVVKPSGLSGGLHAGYQHQFNSLVIGAEVDYTWYDADARAFTPLNGFNRFRSTEIENAWSVAAKFGYAFDRALGFVKAGYSNAELKYINTRIDTGAIVGQSDDRVGGFLIGTGVEHAITDNVIIGAEYRFTKYSVGDQQQFRNGVAVSAFNDNNKLQNHSLNLRLSYKF
jgi:outer membrane immunogenic protein